MADKYVRGGFRLKPEINPGTDMGITNGITALSQVMVNQVQAQSQLGLNLARVANQQQMLSQQGELALQVILSSLTGKGVNLDQTV
jgi:hypothetical protein